MPTGVTAYYPQPGPVILSSGGDWSVSATIGRDTPADVGRGYVLVTALADQEGNAALHAYIAQSNNNGLQSLPKGIQLMSQVHVRRG